MPADPSTPRQGRVVLLCGPSGSGKTRLADHLHARHGWPIVRLDDFYRDEDDPGLPRLPALGIPDWDDPASWDVAAAVQALEGLVTAGSAEVPEYDISLSRRVGARRITCQEAVPILAEGVFAAELVAPLRERGLLHGAWCVRGRPSVTMVRRLARDLKERRKPPLVLVRRGWALMRSEPELVRRAAAKGAQPTTARHLSATLEARARATPAGGAGGIR